MTPSELANERREQARTVLARHSMVSAAAKELELTKDALTNMFRRVGETASQWLGRVSVPEGHRVKGNSTLSDAQGNTVGRWTKTDLDSDEPKFSPVPPEHTVRSTSTLLGSQGEVRAQWVSAAKDEATLWEQFWSAASKAAEAHKGLAEPTPVPSASMENLCTVYPLGDPHIGMLSWSRETGQDFDLSIAKRELIAVVDMLVDRAPASKLAILANVGDFFHAEDDNQRTPRGGNKLDVDSRARKIAEVGFALMRQLVDRLLEKHERVMVVNAPGNHDPKMSQMLALWLGAVYEREPRVEIVDNASPFTYIRFGKTLIGIVHGDDQKPEELPGIMAADRPEDWGATVDRFWVTGHVHHLSRKEYTGRVVVETFRTLAASDAWHNKKGYRSGKSLCAITFDREYGEDVRVTVPLRRVGQVAT